MEMLRLEGFCLLLSERVSWEAETLFVPFGSWADTVPANNSPVINPKAEWKIFFMFYLFWVAKIMFYWIIAFKVWHP